MKYGFTIVELLVALFLSSILVIGVISIFITTQKGVEAEDQLVVMEQNNRIAMEYLARDIRMAGLNIDRSVEWQGSCGGTTRYIKGQPAFINLTPYQIVFNGDIYAKDTSETAEQTNPAAIIDNNLPFDLIAYRPVDPTNGVMWLGGTNQFYCSLPVGASYRAETIKYSFDRNGDVYVNEADYDPSFNPWDFVLTRTINNGVIQPDPIAFGLRGITSDPKLPTSAKIANGGRYPNGSYPLPLFQYWVDSDFDPTTPATLWGDTNGDGILSLGSTGEVNNLVNDGRWGAVVLDSDNDNNEDDNGNGVLDDGEDINKNGKLDTNLLDLHLERIVISVTTTARNHDPAYIFNEKSKQPQCKNNPDNFNPANPTVPNCYRFRERTFQTVIEPRNIEERPSLVGGKPPTPPTVSATIELCTGTLGDTPETSSVPVIVSWSGSPDDGGGEDDIVGYAIYRAPDYNKDNVADMTPERIDFVTSQSTPGQSSSPKYTYQDNTAKVATRYLYMVSAIDVGNQESIYSTPASIYVAVPRPAPPFRGVVNLNNEIQPNPYSVIAFDRPGDITTATGNKIEWQAAALSDLLHPDDNPDISEIQIGDEINDPESLVHDEARIIPKGEGGLMKIKVLHYNIYRFYPGQTPSSGTKIGSVSKYDWTPHPTQLPNDKKPHYSFIEASSSNTLDKLVNYAVTTEAQVSAYGKTKTCESNPVEILCPVMDQKRSLSPPIFFDKINVQNVGTTNEGEAISVTWRRSPNENKSECPSSQDPNCNNKITHYGIYRRPEGGAYKDKYGADTNVINTNTAPLYYMAVKNPPYSDSTAFYQDIIMNLIDKKVNHIDLNFPTVKDYLTCDETNKGVLCPLDYKPNVGPWADLFKRYDDLLSNTSYCYTVASLRIDLNDNTSPIKDVYSLSCEICASTSINCECNSPTKIDVNLVKCPEDGRDRGTVKVGFWVTAPKYYYKYVVMRSDSAYGDYVRIGSVSTATSNKETYLEVIDDSLFENLNSTCNNTSRCGACTSQEVCTDTNYLPDSVGTPFSTPVTFYYRIRCENKVTGCKGSLSLPILYQVGKPKAPQEVRGEFIPNTCLSANKPYSYIYWNGSEQCPTSPSIIGYEILRKRIDIETSYNLIAVISAKEWCNYNSCYFVDNTNTRLKTFLPDISMTSCDSNNGGSTCELVSGGKYSYIVKAIAQIGPHKFESDPSISTEQSVITTDCSCKDNEIIIQDNFSDREETITNIPCYPKPPYGVISCINDDSHRPVQGEKIHSYPIKESISLNSSGNFDYESENSKTNFVYKKDSEKGRKSALKQDEGGCSDCFGTETYDKFPSMTLRNNPNWLNFLIFDNDFATFSNDEPPPRIGVSIDPGANAFTSTYLNNLQNYLIKASLRTDLDKFSAAILFRYVDDSGIRNTGNLFHKYYGVSFSFDNTSPTPGGTYWVRVLKGIPPSEPNKFRRAILADGIGGYLIVPIPYFTYNNDKYDYSWYTVLIEVCNVTISNQIIPRIRVKIGVGKNVDDDKLQQVRFISPTSTIDLLCSTGYFPCVANDVDSNNNTIVYDRTAIGTYTEKYLEGKIGFMEGATEIVDLPGYPNRVYFDDIRITQLCTCPTP